MKTIQNPNKSTSKNSDVFFNSGSGIKRAIIYSRVSTADQDAQNQVVQLKDYASKQGWQIVDVIIDVASGGKDASERAGLGKVLTLGHQRRYDILLFWSLDRFSREGSRKTIGYLTQLESFGVDFHSFTEPYLSTLGVFSDAIIAILASLARQEKIRISERTRASLQILKQQLNEKGLRLGRPSVSPTRITEAKKLRATGLSFATIGEQLGISRVRAFQLCKGDAKVCSQMAVET